MSNHLLPWVCLGLFTVACVNEERGRPSEDMRPGIQRSIGGFVLRTPPVAVQPGEELFACYAVTTEEDMAIRVFRPAELPFVHHLVLAETLEPEPDGTSECDVLFRSTWVPLYGTTTAPTEVRIPEGAAKLIPSGAQLLVQAHLVNPTDEVVTPAIELELESTDAASPTPVGITLLGTANIVLPPQRTTTVETTCRFAQDARFYAFLPHMHAFGRRFELDIGLDETSFERAFTRDPFDYEDQRFERFDRQVGAGSFARVRCTFENTTSEPVQFGEGSSAEMCFAVAFRVGGDAYDACTATPVAPSGGVPRRPDAGVCGEGESSTGIGRRCTRGGAACATGQACSSDFLQTNEGICIQLGCTTSDVCGVGATCCTLPEVGSLANVCVPEACRPETCIPVGLDRPVRD